MSEKDFDKGYKSGFKFGKEVMQEKIDKAIAEMEAITLVMSCEEMRDLCIEIIKRNIGE